MKKLKKHAPEVYSRIEDLVEQRSASKGEKSSKHAVTSSMSVPAAWMQSFSCSAAFAWGGIAVPAATDILDLAAVRRGAVGQVPIPASALIVQASSSSRTGSGAPG